MTQCFDCHKQATHQLNTQFAGTHYYCGHHATLHPEWAEMTTIPQPRTSEPNSADVQLALRLADELETVWGARLDFAAAELRRLHSVELNLQRLNENHTDLIMSNRCLRVINEQLLRSLKLAQQWIAGMEPKDKVSGFALICSAIAAASNKTSK